MGTFVIVTVVLPLQALPSTTRPTKTIESNTNAAKDCSVPYIPMFMVQCLDDDVLRKMNISVSSDLGPSKGIAECADRVSRRDELLNPCPSPSTSTMSPTDAPTSPRQTEITADDRSASFLLFSFMMAVIALVTLTASLIKTGHTCGNRGQPLPECPPQEPYIPQCRANPIVKNLIPIEKTPPSYDQVVDPDLPDYETATQKPFIEKI